MFEPFHRLEGSRNRETGGTGLGLPIARNILRAHGGDVTLANRAGWRVARDRHHAGMNRRKRAPGRFSAPGLGTAAACRGTRRSAGT